MLNLLKSLIGSSSPYLYILCAIGGFATGVYVTADHYRGLMAKLNNELLEATKTEIEDYAKRLSQATDALVRSNHSGRALSDANSRLRDRLRDADRRETERVKASTDSAYKERYGTCRRLLIEGVEILHEGDELARELAVEKDALVTLIK